MNDNYNFVFSIVTVIAVLIALWQTQLQIKLSNKQSLFDKRINNYIIAKGLLTLYEENRSHFNERDREQPILTIDIEFILLTNNAFLEGIAPAIKVPLKEPNHKKLLFKIEELREVSIKSKFLFSGNDGILLADFTSKYQELLFSMYQYQILFSHINEANKEAPVSLEEISKRFKEGSRRQELLEAFDNLEQCYLLVIKEKTEERIEKKISLE